MIAKFMLLISRNSKNTFRRFYQILWNKFKSSEITYHKEFLIRKFKVSIIAWCSTKKRLKKKRQIWKCSNFNWMARKLKSYRRSLIRNTWEINIRKVNKRYFDHRKQWSNFQRQLNHLQEWWIDIAHSISF